MTGSPWWERWCPAPGVGGRDAAGGGGGPAAPTACLGPPSRPAVVCPVDWLAGGKLGVCGTVRGAHQHAGGLFSTLQRDRQTGECPRVTVTGQDTNCVRSARETLYLRSSSSSCPEKQERKQRKETNEHPRQKDGNSGLSDDGVALATDPPAPVPRGSFRSRK